MTSPTPWEACGNVIRDADSIEVCTVALWCEKPSEVAARIVRAVNAHEGLVEACEKAQHALRNFVDHHTHNAAVDALAAAITKARQ